LRRSAIHALETAETEEDFEKSWHFVRDNFSAIVTQSNGIKEFRYFILDLAIRGKLTSQNPDDEPATTLLSKIKLEKQEINQKSLNLSSKDKVVIEAPFDIPKNWLWVHLFEVCLKITDGEHLTPNYSNTGVPMLSAKHIGQQSLILKDYKLVSNEDAKQFWGRCFPEKGDILIVSRGGGIGRVIISDRDNYCLMGSVLLLKVSRFIRNKYLLYYLLSSTGNEKLKNTSNFTAQEAIYITHLKRNYVIPLPPLEEQKRIVNKVDELMKICDRAEESLRKKEELASAISASVIHHLKL
ncbi:MAG: restriction endonuclease subunit S, partial [Halothece sp.]